MPGRGLVATVAIAIVVAVIGCGDREPGARSQVADGGLTMRVLWEQPSSSSAGGAADSRTGRQLMEQNSPQGGFGNPIPAEVNTIRFVFDSENPDDLLRCCVAVDADPIRNLPPGSPERQLVLAELPAGDGRVEIAGFAAGFAPADGRAQCPTDPATAGEPCDARTASPNFQSDRVLVRILPGVLTDAGDIEVRKLGTPTASPTATPTPTATVTLTPTASATPEVLVLVANAGSENISVIDTLTNTVRSTITLGNGSVPFDIAVSADNRFAYVTDTGLDTLAVVDIATGSAVLVPGVSVGPAPRQVAVAETGNGAVAYVVNNGSGPDTGTVSALDITSDPALPVPIGGPIAVGSLPQGIAIAVLPSATLAYVANTGSDDVSVIDTATNQVVGGAIALGTEPRIGPNLIALTPDSAFAYVTNGSTDDVRVIDTATNAVLASRISVGSIPIGIAIAPTPGGTFAYVANQADATVSVIDTATNSAAGAAIAVGSTPQFVTVATNQNGTFAYVSDTGSDEVSVINTATNTVVATVPVGTQPLGMAVATIPPPAP